ncbi:MAG: hypothetical protein HQ518_02095 [Rhodopirellula sp.]|nr:hypothetical protein [Rhodopirellula sp.]
MKIYVTQIYIQAGVGFPFTHRFQQFISRELTNRVQLSERFIEQYGEDFDLTFNMVAKSEIADTEIKGPTVFRRDKNVEYTIFLPFDDQTQDSDLLHSIVVKLLAGIVRVLDDLKFDTTRLSGDSLSLADHVVNDPVMTK